MAYSADIAVVNVRETIRALNKIEPGLRKQFVADVKQIAQPAVNEVRRSYYEVPLSGMSRTWKDPRNDRKLFPFTIAKAQRGVQVQVNTDRRSDVVISIIQRDPGTAVFETAGRANRNPLGDALGLLRPGRTRIIGPAVYRTRRLFEKELQDSIARMSKRVQKELN
jgi:hypothetical protein